MTNTDDLKFVKFVKYWERLHPNQTVIHPDKGSRHLCSLGSTGKWPYVLDVESRVSLVIG